MCLTEYNEEATMQMFREEGREEGLKEGLKKGSLETLLSLVQDGIIPFDIGVKKAGMEEAEFAKLLK